MIKFSIIIPVRTINDFLRESILHLKNLDYKDFEVLIIVDFKSDYDFNGDTRFKVIVAPEDRRSPGEKRNLGAQRSTGSVLAFLDDDAYPKKSWLKEAAELFSEDKELYALGAPAMTPSGVSILELGSGRVLESYLTSGFTAYRHIPMSRRLINDYPTVNLFVRKEAFLNVGGFDKEFWPGEDTKLCLDLVNYYKRDFLYDPKPQVYHHRRELLFPHLKQISRYGRYRGQFARIFPKTSLLPSYFIPSIFTLGLILGPFVSYFYSILWSLYFGVISFYITLLVCEGVRLGFKDNLSSVSKNIRLFMLIVLGIFYTHLFYGTNFIVGLIKRPKLKLREIDKKTGNYLGG